MFKLPANSPPDETKLLNGEGHGNQGLPRPNTTPKGDQVAKAPMERGDGAVTSVKAICVMEADGLVSPGKSMLPTDSVPSRC